MLRDSTAMSPAALAESAYSRLKWAILRPAERPWREDELLLERRGYRLRPRYGMYWRPSWEQRGSGVLDSDEDAVVSPVSLSPTD